MRRTPSATLTQALLQKKRTFSTDIFCFSYLFLNLQSTKQANNKQKYIDMKVKEIVEKLNLKVLSGEKGLDREIDGCYISDLLSDVMGNAMEGNIWITLQTHKNVMAVASLKELACIILVKNLVPNDETIEQSNDDDLPILQTSLPTYEIAGLVYNLLNNK